MSTKHPMTPYGKSLLEKELDQLIKKDREEIKVAIAEARELGDLKENAEYHAAKERQSHIEGRISYIQGRLAQSQLVDPSQVDQSKIVFGAYVKLIKDSDESEHFLQVVGEDEAQTDETKISYTSPLGSSLIGKEEGDEVIVRAPKGNIVYIVEEFSYSPLK